MLTLCKSLQLRAHKYEILQMIMVQKNMSHALMVSLGLWAALGSFKKFQSGLDHLEGL